MRALTKSLSALGCAVLLVGGAEGGDVWTPGFRQLIPVSIPRDNVFSPERGIVYFSRSGISAIGRYDLNAHAFLPSLEFTNSTHVPSAMDISPDGQWLVTTASGIDDVTGYLGRFDLDTGEDEGVSYPHDSFQGGAYDITIANNGKAFFTSASVSNLREFDLATGEVTVRTDAPGSNGGRLRDRSGVFPSGDRGTIFAWEGNISSGPGFLYDATTDSFGPSSNLNNWNNGGSVNRDGTLISTPNAVNPRGQQWIRDRSLQIIRQVGVSNGAQFNTVYDELYVLDVVIDQIVAYDTNTWSELYRFPVGEPIDDGRYFQEGHMTMSPDGQYLFLNTDSGIRVYAVPEPTSFVLVALLSGAIVARHRRHL